MNAQAKPIWLDDSLTDHAFAQKPKDHRYGQLTKKPGTAAVVCRQAIPSGTPTNSVFIRMPVDVAERLKRLTQGAHSVAAWLLIEAAMNNIEAKGETWTFTIEPKER